MPLQPLQLPTHPHVCVSGDVVIHPSAAIAPGVVLRAAPHSRITIAGGACIGMGVILNAYQGSIEIEEGVSLGPGVLVVGDSTIGTNACVGGATTIFNASVEPMQVISAGSIIGDTFRQVSAVLETEEEPIPDEQPSPESSPSDGPSLSDSNADSKPTQSPIYGQVHVNQLLLTLFPHGQSFSNRSPTAEEKKGIDNSP